MTTEKRRAYSPEMEKNIKAVKLMFRKIGFDENIGKVNWKFMRRVSDFGYKFMPKEKGVTFRKVTIGGVPCIAAEPEVQTTDNIILYIHGGGFVSGSAESSKGFCSMLAKCGGCRVISVDYDLSPESKYPTALNRCVKVYSTIVKRRKGCKIALCGESAGGNLSLATALKVIAEGGVKPACVIAHSPLADFSGTLDRHINENRDFIVKDGCSAPLSVVYGCDNDKADPFASPVFGDFTGFPPIFLTCDANETLYADALAIAERASEKGVKVKMIEMTGTFHAFATIGNNTPETAQILEESIEFFRENF